MVSSSFKTEQRQFMRRYVLGQASLQERRDFEQQYLDDNELFEELVDEEEDLIRSYLQGDLNQADRKGFEEWFLQGPKRRARVKLAKTLLSSALHAGLATDKMARGSQGGTTFVRTLVHPSIPRVWLQWAAVLLFVVLAGGSWIAITLHRRAVKQDRAGVPPAQLNQGRETASRPDQQGTKPVLSASADKRTIPGRFEYGQSGPSETPSFTLTSDVNRGGGNAAKFTVPHNAQEVKFSIRLERNLCSSCTVILESEGKELWRSGSPIHSVRHELVVKLPSSVLTDGDYVFVVLVLGGAEEVAEYPFRISIR